MIHERFDLNRWQTVFPLDKLRKEARGFVEARRLELPKEYPNRAALEAHEKLMSPGGEIITSPRHLATVEQLRVECLGKRCVPTFPTDVFAFAAGEPPDRRATKIGGLPFWPRERTWPVGKSGDPMNFVAQFCFADSKDLFPALPGDVMLIFSDGAYGKDWGPGNDNALKFEWVNWSQVELIEPTDVPKARWVLYPVYGEIFRTVDYLVGDVWEKAWWPVLFRRCKSPRDFLSGLGARRALHKAYTQPWCVEIIQGTKIGGIPSWIQPPEDLPGRFLCTLGSIHPDYQLDDSIPRPYPFTNVPGPFTRGRGVLRSADEEIQRNSLLMWDDVGSLYLFLDDTGAVHWTIQFY